jgi:NAD(P)-dependent dehydrogenase (short-subunit alcohol dehydrogenase family)
MTLQGKRVVVLGGTSGLGLATAKAAAEAGAQLVVASSSRHRVDAALEALPKTASATGHAVDLSKEEAVRALFETIGAFDHLVFTAGENLELMTLDRAELAKARHFFELRYWGAFTAAKYGSPKLRKGGSIVFTGGSAAARPQSGWALGASVCAAMEGLTRALAVELAPIRVNLVAPGVVRTELWGKLSEPQRDAMFAELGKKLPVGRVGEPSDIAQAFVFLMSNGYSSGEILNVNGGANLV